MIKCTNCEVLFNNKNDLSLIIYQNEFYDNAWHTTDAFKYEDSMKLKESKILKYEVFRGCPYCNCDDFLIDLNNTK